MSGGEWLIGLHLLTLHAPSHYVEQTAAPLPLPKGYYCAPGSPVPMTYTDVRRRYRTATLGLYGIHASGATVGVLRNSYGDPAAYAGWTWGRDDIFGLTVGGVIGYDGATIRPIIVPSVKLWSVRVAAMPKIRSDGATVVHVAYEVKWK